jgi:hypothetical protein
MTNEEKVNRKNRRYASHLPVLKYLFDEYDIKNVIELGMGNHSTPFFLEQDIESLVSVETDRDWIQICKEKHGVSNRQIIVYHHDVESLNHITSDYDLGFVDCKPNSIRGACVNKLIDSGVNIIVMHDFEPQFQDGYGYKKISLSEDYQLLVYQNQEPYRGWGDPWTGVIIKKSLVDEDLLKFINCEG